MSNQVYLLPSALLEIFAQATASGRITLADRYGLMAAVLDNSLSEEEQRMVNRLLYAIRRGWLEIVNEISMIA